MKKLVFLLIILTLMWSGGSMWVLLYVGESAGILCIFSSFIISGLIGIGYMIHVAFFMGKGGRS